MTTCLFQRDTQAQKEHFRRVFMEHVYPLYHTLALPPLRLADQELEQVDGAHRLIWDQNDKYGPFRVSFIKRFDIFLPFEKFSANMLLIIKQINNMHYVIG